MDLTGHVSNISRQSHLPSGWCGGLLTGQEPWLYTRDIGKKTKKLDYWCSETIEEWINWCTRAVMASRPGASPFKQEPLFLVKIALTCSTDHPLPFTVCTVFPHCCDTKNSCKKHVFKFIEYICILKLMWAVHAVLDASSCGHHYWLKHHHFGLGGHSLIVFQMGKSLFEEINCLVQVDMSHSNFVLRIFCLLILPGLLSISLTVTS